MQPIRLIESFLDVCDEFPTSEELLAIALAKSLELGPAAHDRRQVPDRRSGTDRRKLPGDEPRPERRSGSERRQEPRRLSDIRRTA
jgi:hypothetical protein